jgi:hypothetical protein
MNLNGPMGDAIFFIALWLSVCYGVGLLSGWRELARAYRHTGTFVGARWRFQSGKMLILMRIHNALTVGVNPQGFYLGTFVLFRVGNAQLLIPWSDLSGRPGNCCFGSTLSFAFARRPMFFCDCHPL